jgi:hypothetical protein
MIASVPTITIPRDVPEDTTYRLFVEVYKPFVRNKHGDQIARSGVYYNVGGSAIVFEADSLADVEEVLKGAREVMERLPVRIKPGKPRTKR